MDTAAPSPSAAPRSRHAAWAPVLALTAVAWLSGCADQSAPAASPAEPPPAPAARRALVKATGVIKPRVGAEVRVGSRVSGVVSRLHVQVGDRVKKGDLLAELDDRDFRARRDQAGAELERALAEGRFAESELRRKRELRDANVISSSDWDVAERALAVAEQQVLAARASLALAQAQWDYTRITAPINGVVASIATQEGETIAASFAAPTFLTLVDLDRLEVWAYVDETDIGRVTPGLKGTFTVDTYRDEPFSGYVTTIYPKAEIRDNVVNYVAVVAFEPPAGRVLRPEMTTTVRLELPEPSPLP